MNEQLFRSEKYLNLSLTNLSDHETIAKINQALSSVERLKIMHILLSSSRHLSDIATTLNMPVSSVSRHIDILADAGLVAITYRPGKKGHTKFCARDRLFGYTVSLDDAGIKTLNAQEEYKIEMPIGMFTHCHIKAPCGMNGKNASIEHFDDPRIFFLPSRIRAECLWFTTGFVSYSFPSPPDTKQPFSSLSFSFEACSEAIGYNTDWPSDVTVSINNKEVCTFTLPGDFGGRRGIFSPRYWPITSTQYGILKNITVSNNGVFIDNVFLHKNIIFDDLNVYNGNAIKFTIGVKNNAEHQGGLNLFGKNFGDYQQAIIMTLR